MMASSELATYCTESVWRYEDQLVNDDSSAHSAAGHALKSSIWVGRDVLRVYFLNDNKLKSDGWTCGHNKTATLNFQNIMDWATNAWGSAGRTSIPRFEKTDSPDKADIRVEFSDKFNESRLGSLATKVDPNKPTMFLKLKGCDQKRQKFLVIHEFGHALGLLHEHQRSDFWSVASTLLSEDKIKKDIRMKKVNFERDFFQTQKVGAVKDQKYDPDSVMHYWFDVDWLVCEDHKDLAKVERDPNLSEEQKEILRGIHKRHLSNPEQPSDGDLDFLERLYSQVGFSGGPEKIDTAEDTGDSEELDSEDSAEPEKYSEYNNVSLGPDHSNDLFDEAYEARNEWTKMGKRLGIRDDSLKAIDTNHRSDPSLCFSDMLHKWLTGGYPNKNLGHFLRTLAYKTVDKEEYCKNVIRKICPKKRKSDHRDDPPARKTRRSKDN